MPVLKVKTNKHSERIIKIILSFAFFTAILALCSFADEKETETAIRLSKKLNNLQMFDYSIDALEQEISKRPKDVDLLYIQKGLTYFLMNKPDDANKIISSIRPISPYYPDSRRILGIEAVKKGKNDLAVQALEDYFKVFLKNPPATKTGEKEFLYAIEYLKHAYTMLGRSRDVERVVKYREALQKEKGDKRETSLLTYQAKLDSVEKLIADGGSGWNITANSVLPPLSELIWEQDLIAALAYIEKARAYFFLGRFDDALKEIEDKNSKALIDAFDEGYEKEKMFYNAPSVHARFWHGKILLGKAKKAVNKDEQIALYKKAIHDFYKIISDYEAFPRADDAISAFNEIEEALRKLGKIVKLPPEFKQKLAGAPSFSIKKADQFFADNQYDKAIPLYLEAFHKSRRAKGSSGILSRLAYSFVKTGQTLEAMAVAGYLADNFQKSSKTPLALLQVGEFLWNEANKHGKGDPLYYNKIDDALSVYEDYLRNCPTDQYADEISARVAKVSYDLASSLAEEANKLPQGSKEKIEKNKEARDAFRKAIPHYQRIIDNYAPTDFGINSFYYLAWCHTNTKEYLKGAELFLIFCDKEINREDKAKKDLTKLADSKFRAAENYFQHAVSLEKESKNLREEAGKMSASKLSGQPEPKEEKSEKEKEIKQNAGEKKSGKETEKENLHPEQLIVKAENLEKEALLYHNKSITHINELIGEWRKPGGLIAQDNSNKTLKTLENAYSLLGWALNGTGEKQKACEAFADFLKRYPQSEKIPSSMLQMGMIYLDLENYNSAAQVLETLAGKYPETKEGKNALASLGRSMYEIKKYDKAIEAFQKIFKQNIDLSISVLKWAAKNLVDCDGKHPKEGAALSSTACSVLFEKLKKPVIADWVGKQMAKELVDNSEKLKETLNILREQLSFDAANAAFWGGEYEKAINYLNELLQNKKTPYYFDGRFLRAKVYSALKQYDNARGDYSDVSIGALQLKPPKESLYFKSQCMIGDSYIEEENYSRALGAFNIIAMTSLDEKHDEGVVQGRTVQTGEEEMKAQREWIEYAIYKAAYCLAKLDRKKERDAMVEKYLKYFKSGRFCEDIAKLPPPQAANKE